MRMKARPGIWICMVGRLKPTGTPWDRAIITPIEYNWMVHGLGTGHAEGETRIEAAVRWRRTCRACRR